MDELCETLDGRAVARGGVGTSHDGSADMVATPEESEEVREQQRRLLAEIRSCFRVLSIHSRLRGSESPRTRRISTQTDGCESLHFLATDRAKGNTPRVLRGLSPTEDAQNSLLYNQLIIESTSTSSISSPASAGLQSHVGQQTGDEEEEEPFSESIHERPVVNPTSRLKTAVDLSKAEALNVVEWLYRDHRGAVWRAATRKAMEDQVDSKHLIYGEVTFVAFAKLLETYAPRRPFNGSPLSASKEMGKLLTNSSEREDIFPRGFTFYDLGCGAGRPVYLASLLNTNCTKSCGIEIVPRTAADFFYTVDWYLGSNSCVKIFVAPYTSHCLAWPWEDLHKVQPNLHPEKQSQKLDFLYGDFLQIDWSDGDIIFINATCFGDQVFSQFEEIATKMLKPGAIVISVTRKFNDLDSWELLEMQERQMSWAPALVYVYRKKNLNPPNVDIPSTSAAPGIIIEHLSFSSPEHVAQPVEIFENSTIAPELSMLNTLEIIVDTSPPSSSEYIAQLVETAPELSTLNSPPT